MEHAKPAMLIFMLLTVGPVLYFIFRAKRGASIRVRRIAGIDAIDEGIGRSVELGRPISFTTALTPVTPTLYACLGVLRHIARKAAVFSAKLLVPSSDPEVLALTDATLQNAYREEKRYSQYDPTSIRYLSREQFAFASGYMGIIHREKVGSAFLFGTFAAESLILAEAGQQVGAIQVAATVSAEQIPFFITACDYTLLGEELYAASAYLSKDPVQTGSLRGQDFGKLLILLLVVLGAIESTYLGSGTDYHPEEPKPTHIQQWMELSWNDLVKKFSAAEPSS